MYSAEEILEKVVRASKLAQKAELKAKERKDYTEAARLFGEEYLEVLPDYYKGYREVVKDYNDIRIHADKNCFPAALFAKRAPNQTEKAARWMYDNYKNVTNPVYIDFLNTTLRCTHDQNWSITFGADNEIYKDETFKKYLEEGIDIYGSLESFFKNVMFSLQLTDPMGVIAVKPEHLPTMVNEAGELVISPDELIEPQPVYYTCKQVVTNDDDCVLVDTNRRVWVEYGNTKKDWGRVYEFYDDENIWVITQVGKYIENTFELVLYYAHEWGNVPAIKLRGIPTIYEGTVIWKSPFLFATDILDLVAQNSAYLQASIAKCVFPATVMLGDICVFEMDGQICDDGWFTFWEGETSRRSRCPNCNGLGVQSRLGALETLYIKPEVRGQSEGELKSGGQKPLEYISPEVHTLEFLMKKIESDEIKARNILHLKTSNSKVQGSEDTTATGQALDMKSTFAFILPIANTAFHTFEFLINAIGYMRYKDNFVSPSISYPQTFDIGTEQDILANISNMVATGVPAVLIQAEIFRYLKSVFYTDAKTAKIYELMVNSDRLLVMSSEEIQLREAKGLAEKWEVILHDSFVTFTDELMQDERFLTYDLPTQKAMLFDLAKVKANEILEARKIETPDITLM